MKTEFDAIIIGSGPNGLTAAAHLAKTGYKCLVLEKAPTPGGGTRTAELTLPGFQHDVCSAVHPTGLLSPAFQELDLSAHGLEWAFPEYSATHPLSGQSSAILSPNMEETLDSIDAEDRKALSRLAKPLLEAFPSLVKQILEPVSLKKDFFQLARFGIPGLVPARALASICFQGERAKALFAGCAAHSILPLRHIGTSAVGLVFLLSGLRKAWPIAKGGSQSISQALLNIYAEHGGTIICDKSIERFKDLPPAKTYLFDLSPRQVARICEDELPKRYRNQLERYHYGPGVFKLDYALSSPIPWKDASNLKTATVHLGGSLDEIAQSESDCWNGRISEKPFTILCQQSEWDASRAPEGMRTAYAYCHVPHGCEADMTRAVEDQIEEHAPGFKDCILQRAKTSPRELERYNPSYHGGAITGGAASIDQLFTRPVMRFDPYSTPNRSIFICSHSTPPGGGVHGMCGYNAAQSALKRLKQM